MRARISTDLRRINHFRCISSSLFYINALCFLIAVLVSAQSMTDGPCNPAAMLTGADEVIAPIAQILEANGVSTSPVVGCPAVRARVEQQEAALFVQTEDVNGRRSERSAVDHYQAAALIESWARGDISLSLLDVPVADDFKPTPPLEPSAVRPVFFHLLAEVSGGLGSSVWFGGSFGTCAMIGPFCLGAITRLAYDPSIAGDSKELETKRLGLDTLLISEFPIDLKIVSLIPGLGFGAGWIRSIGYEYIYALDADYDRADEDERLDEDRTREETAPDKRQASIDSGGLRADAYFRISFHLRGGLALDLGFVASFAILAHTDDHINRYEIASETERGSSTTTMAGDPWCYFRGVVGLRYGLQ
ncbi:MAG: hypothetical protein GY847_20660 [Proteobacteria bacterium]|nr:hypothetical protein [Pseudomonadota bacterium]